MKVLHTSDWHLGAKLENRSREEEHKSALRWILELVRAEKVDMLIIAGDIFDTYNPPNYAERLYYDFIKQLSATGCQLAVVLAGNHDSAPKLEAARQLLEAFNVKIIAQIPQNLQEHLIEFKDPSGQLRAVVAAVPFLPDSYLRQSSPAQTTEERVAELRKAIQNHYAAMSELCAAYEGLDIPIITTGHLFVAQADKSGRERANIIHLGALDVVGTDCFSACFDYVALGHLHQPHSVGGQHIRYAGSLIPLDFSESRHPQQVYIVEWEGKKLHNISSHKNPHRRELLLWSGDEASIRQKIKTFKPSPNPELKTWLRLEIFSEGGYDTSLRDSLLADIRGLDLELIGEPRMRKLSQYQQQGEEEQIPDLKMLQPSEVFALKLDAEDIKGEEKQGMLDLFAELLAWREEQAREQR